MIKEEDIDIGLQKKIPLIYTPVAKIVEKMYDWTSTIHTDIPQSTLDIMHSDIPKLYVGLHKSLWETMGVPVVIGKQDAQVPYIVIGKNLVKGISKPLMKAVGCIYVERAAKDEKHQDYHSALEIKKKITIGLDRGYDVLIFPTDGRTKDGQTASLFSTPFDAALAHSKNGPVYIIPVDVDYERVNDLPRMLKCIAKDKPYTFRIWHFPDWWKDLGNIYVNFGEPIEINEKTNRKKINFYTLEKAKDLVKILKVNVLSEAILRINNRDFTKKQLSRSIDNVIEELKPQENKFIGFKNTEDIIRYSEIELGNSDNLPSQPRLPFNLMRNLKISLKYPEIARRIYAGYISHYLPKR